MLVSSSVDKWFCLILVWFLLVVLRVSSLSLVVISGRLVSVWLREKLKVCVILLVLGWISEGCSVLLRLNFR